MQESVHQVPGPNFSEGPEFMIPSAADLIGVYAAIELVPHVCVPGENIKAPFAKDCLHRVRSFECRKNCDTEMYRLDGIAVDDGYSHAAAQ